MQWQTGLKQYAPIFRSWEHKKAKILYIQDIRKNIVGYGHWVSKTLFLGYLQAPVCSINFPNMNNILLPNLSIVRVDEVPLTVPKLAKALLTPARCVILFPVKFLAKKYHILIQWKDLLDTTTVPNIIYPHSNRKPSIELTWLSLLFFKVQGNYQSVTRGRYATLHNTSAQNSWKTKLF
jgi:hypothetical protein